MRHILVFLTTLFLFGSCSKKSTKEPEYAVSATVNGSTWNSNNTSPSTSGSYVTLYYHKSTQNLTVTIINAETKEKVILILKATASESNTSHSFNTTNYIASFYLGDEAKLMNKKVNGNILIRQLTLSGDKIERFDADFSFVQDSEDLEGNPYSHKIENAKLKNLKGTQ